MSLKIGLLLPNSNFIPFFSRDFLKALELGLSQNGEFSYELSVEPTSYNVDKNVVADKLQKLIIQQQVDVIVAPLNVGLFEHVGGFLSSNQVPLIVTSMGEDVLFQYAQNPFIFTNSFHLWHASWMAGYWGASEYGKKTCTLAALHDGGYGMGFAFAVGVEAQGGQLLQTAITHRDSRTEDPSAFIQDILAQKPDFIFGLYAGKEAVSFINAYHQIGDAKKIPLIGLPPLFAEDLWDELDDRAVGTKLMSSWDCSTDASLKFKQIFSQQTGHPLNSYALLAYETGQLIAKSVTEIGSQKSLLQELPEALKTTEINSPRGQVSFDPKTLETSATMYLQEVIKNAEGKLQYQTRQSLETPDLFYEQLALARSNLIKQGWLNPYLIA